MRVADITLDWLEEHLSGFEWDSRSNTGIAWCPCHADEGTSMKGLSVTLNPGGTFLMYCHSCKATGRDVAEHFAGSNGNPPVIRARAKDNTASKGKGGMAWWVDYTRVPQSVWEELGCEEHRKGVKFTYNGFSVEKRRDPPKDISFYPGGETVPPFWPVPPDELPERITITEGESDCGTAHAAGLPYALALTKGAKTPLNVAMFMALRDRGVKEVVLCGDADDSGQQFMRECVSYVTGAGLKCYLVHLDEVLDPFSNMNDLNSIWKTVNGDVSQFTQVIERATRLVSARVQVLTVEQLQEVAKQKPKWQIPNLIAPGDKVLISGPQKSYKTWMQLALIKALVTGEASLESTEWIPEEPTSCLLIEAEGSRHRFAQRIERLKLHPEHRAFFLHRAPVYFNQPSTIDEIISLCLEEDIQNVFFDPLQRMIPGIDDNDANATGVIWDEVFRMQQLKPDLTVYITHHSNKAERLTWESIRGSSRHAGEVDLGMFVQKIDKGLCNLAVDGRDIPAYMGATDALEVRIEISEDGETPHFKATAKPVDVQISKRERDKEKGTDEILNAITQGCKTIQSIISNVSVSERTVRTRLQILVKENKIEEVDHGPGKPKEYVLREGE